MRTIKFYLKSGQLAKDEYIIQRANAFLKKARNNLITLDLLFNLNTNKKARDLLRIPKEYDSSEWAVITGYYSMYASALALLAKIGFRSKNHAATILVLEEFFVNKKLLDKKMLLMLENSFFQKGEVEKLSDARQKREIAQYSITKQTTKEIAEKIKKDAYDFVNKVELVLMQK